MKLRRGPYLWCSREFTHRIKSMSMSSWTADEVRALQEGGNEVSTP